MYVSREKLFVAEGKYLEYECSLELYSVKDNNDANQYWFISEKSNNDNRGVRVQQYSSSRLTKEQLIRLRDAINDTLKE